MTVNPTNELCHRLDELGIEHDNHGWENQVWWEDNDDTVWHAENIPNNKAPYVKIDAVLTPKQAIAATVGVEHEIADVHLLHICKRCGVAYELNIIDKGFGKPRFCPNCGGRCIG